MVIGATFRELQPSDKTETCSSHLTAYSLGSVVPHSSAAQGRARPCLVAARRSAWLGLPRASAAPRRPRPRGGARGALPPRVEPAWQGPQGGPRRGCRRAAGRQLAVRGLLRVTRHISVELVERCGELLGPCLALLGRDAGLWGPDEAAELAEDDARLASARVGEQQRMAHLLLALPAEHRQILPSLRLAVLPEAAKGGRALVYPQRPRPSPLMPR